MNLTPKESDIQKSILDYLLKRGFMVWRNNTGGFGGEGRSGKKWWVRAGYKGSGDIIGLTKDGKFLSIEVKRPGQKPTPDQTRFMERVNASGGQAFVATDLYEICQLGF